MKKVRYFIPALALLASSVMFQSCLDDDDNDTSLGYPTAVVTVCPTLDGGFEMRLDDKTVLYPSNMSSSPYGQKEVRALVNYTVDKNSAAEGNIFVTVNRLDSIRTKYPAVSLGEADDETFGNDPIEIVRDWVTVAEDGYLTLRFRTLWGPSSTPHYISLLTGVNPDDPFELELRHDAKGDVNGVWKDALIAFNLNLLPRYNGETEKIKLRWNSFTGEKKAEFDICLRPHIDTDEAETFVSAANLR